MDRRAYYRSYKRYRGDPKWIKAKYPGTADDGTPFERGDRVLYWPRMPKVKNIMVGDRAEAAWAQFESEAADEEFLSGGRYGSEDVARELIAIARELTADARDLDQQQVIIGQLYSKLDRALDELVEDPTDVRANLMVTKYAISLEGAVHRLWKAVKADRKARGL